jgi:hypothetical protein
LSIARNKNIIGEAILEPDYKIKRQVLLEIQNYTNKTSVSTDRNIGLNRVSNIGIERGRFRRSNVSSFIEQHEEMII